MAQNTIYRALNEKLGGRNVSEYVGNVGELFWDPDTGNLRISDGVTVGGISVAESSPWSEDIFEGPWVHFVRPDDSPNVVDEIQPGLTIKRNPDGEGWGNIYNSYVVDGDPLDSNGGVDSPYGTSWNTDGWGDLANIRDRYYEGLDQAQDGGGNKNPHFEWVMRFADEATETYHYYLVRFLTWDGGNNEATGAFSWIRRKINVDAFFARIDTSDEETAYEGGDEIAPHLILTRLTGGALFNWGIGDVTTNTNFDLTGSGYDIPATYSAVTGVVSFDTPTGDLLTALTQLNVGDNIYLEWAGSDTSQTVVSAYNPTTMSITLDWAPESTVDLTLVQMDFTEPGRLETDYDDNISPVNTLWNWDGWDDLQNLKSRDWRLFSDLLYANNWVGKVIVGREFIMWDTIADEYYAIKFTRWQKVTEGVSYPGFAYTRRKIDLEKLSHGLKFEDGSTQRTAYTTKVGGTIPQAPYATAQVEERWINADDIGKMIKLDENTTNEIRIPDTSTLQWPIGGVVTILNMSGNDIYIYKDNDDEQGTIYGSGTGDSSTAWVVPDTGGYNLVTLMKIEQGMDNYYNDYILVGSGIEVYNP